METSNTPADEENDDKDRPAGYWDIKPRRLVLMAASFACGTALSVSQVDKVFIAIFFVILLALRIFSINAKILVLIAVCLAAGILNAEIRLPRPGESDISRFSGKRLLIAGSISELSTLKTGDAMRIVIDCKSVRESAGERLCAQEALLPATAVSGRLQATIYYGSPARDSLVRSCIRDPTVGAVHDRPGSDALPLPTVRGKLCKSVLAGQSKPVPDKLAGLKEGDCILLHACLSDLAGARRQRMRLMLARKGIFCQLRTNPGNLIFICHGKTASQNCIDSVATYWRNSLVAFHRLALGAADGDLLASMVLGDRAVSPSQEISDNFRASGLSHILAASGFNLSVVAASIYFVLRFCTGNLWAANSICLSGMLIYVFVAGPSPSVLRAFLMGALLLLSRCLGRTLHMPSALAATMFLVLLFDPGSAADLGFQLSYFSTAGMILGAAQFSDLLSRNWTRCPEWIRLVLAATLVAQSCVLPLQLYYFRQFSSYCLAANVMVSPMVAPLTILGFATSLLYVGESLLHCGNQLSVALDKVSYFPLELLRQEVAFIAHLPFAQIGTGQTQLAAVMLYYAVLLLFPILKSKAKIRLWTLLFVMSLFTLLGTISETDDKIGTKKLAPNASSTSAKESVWQPAQ